MTLTTKKSNENHISRRERQRQEEEEGPGTPPRPRSSSFLGSAIFSVVTILRLIYILSPIILSHSYSSMSEGLQNFLSVSLLKSSPSLMSILVRPSQTLSHLMEARAVQVLLHPKRPSSSSSSSPSIAAIYETNNSIRIPPLLLKAVFALLDVGTSISSSNNTTTPATYIHQILQQQQLLPLLDPSLLMGLFTLLVDIMIAVLLERIASNRLLRQEDGKEEDDEDEEGVLQEYLPPQIKPPYDHIFPTRRSSTKTERSLLSSSPPPSKSPVRPQIPIEQIPIMMASLYYISPFSILPSTIYESWQNIPYALLLLSLYESCRHDGSSISLSTFWLSLAVYIEPSMCVYVIPLIGLYLSSSSSRSSPPSSPSPQRRHGTPSSLAIIIIFILFLFILWTSCLQLLSMTLVRSDVGGKKMTNYMNVLLASYGDAWLPTNPNLSLQWYFHMEIFSRFRTYFGTIFTTVPFVLVGPLTIRFYKYPEVLIASFAMIWTIFRPVQVMLDGNIALIFLLLSPRSLSRMGLASFISICCMFVPVILNVVDNWMWLSVNNGNANYMFFQCLAFNVFMAVILAQFTSATMQRDKAIRIQQKEKTKQQQLEEEEKRKGKRNDEQ